MTMDTFPPVITGAAGEKFQFELTVANQSIHQTYALLIYLLLISLAFHCW
jgi:hypothetical protein